MFGKKRKMRFYLSPEFAKLRHVHELCDKGEHKEQDRGVDWQHDEVLDDARGQDRHKGIAVQYREPQRVQTAVYDRFRQEFRDKDAPELHRFSVEDRAVDHTCDHDVERVAKEEGAAVRFEHVFQDVERAAEDRADPRSEQVFHDAVWKPREADADVGRDKDGSGVVEYDCQCRHQAAQDEIVCDFQFLEGIQVKFLHKKSLLYAAA